MYTIASVDDLERQTEEDSSENRSQNPSKLRLSSEDVRATNTGKIKLSRYINMARIAASSVNLSILLRIWSAPRDARSFYNCSLLSATPFHC